ncbi:MAG: translocation/assembly module TamB domain-containing protein [Sphingomonadales bacterium]|nr:translocation/assembly module TamB domain-containing protein [Sphingomonadales bacterium]
MAGAEPPVQAPAPPPPARQRPRWRRLAVKYLLAVPLLALALLALAVAMLDTGIGHRMIADTLAQWEARNGLWVTVGRIEGSIFRRALLQNVAVADSRGVFLRLPQVRLDWRPLDWFARGLDVRELASQRGVLLRVPALRAAEPTTSVLPDFDVRIDRLAIERLTVAKGVLGAERRFDLHARALIRRKHAEIVLDANAGGGANGPDRVQGLLDADEPANRFALGLDYAAPKGGLLAALTGATQDRRVRIGGRGQWREWHGGLLAEQGGKRAAALAITNRSGRFGVAGQVLPQAFAGPGLVRLLGGTVAVNGAATLADNVLAGSLALDGTASRWTAEGGVDLGGNRFRHLAVALRVRDAGALGAGTVARGFHAETVLDGPLRTLVAPARLAADELALDGTRLLGLNAATRIERHGEAWSMPVTLNAARVVTGNATFDPLLARGTAKAGLVLLGNRLDAGDITVAFPGLAAKLVLKSDIGKGSYGLAGPIVAHGVPLRDVGVARAQARMVLAIAAGPGQNLAWNLGLDLDGRMTRVDNRTLTSLAGDNIRFGGRVATGAGRPLAIERARLDASLLNLAVSGAAEGGATRLSGSGHHATYGGFTVQGSVEGDGPHARLVFADPFPAAGVRDMAVALAPVPQGFHIETEGQSTFGPFVGALALHVPAQGVARIDIERFRVSDTAATGAILLQPAGAEGALTLAGGGVDGTVRLAPRGGGEGLDLALAVHDAKFGGDQPISIGEGRLDAHGLLAKGHTTLDGSVQGAGIGWGRLFLGKVAARATLTDGSGRITAALAGRRGSHFDLQVMGDVAPQNVALVANGSFAGQAIRMPRRARLSAEAGGWRLAPAEIDFAGGRAIASGLFTAGSRELELALDAMPLSLSDVAFANLGLGGTATGLFHYSRPREGLPSGEAKLLLKKLTRSGLVLTSRPIDLALVGTLTATALEARAVASEAGQARGRLQARIGNLAAGGALGVRLRTAPLFAQLRYDGPADAIWRLMAMETFDLTGPLAVAADVTGTVDEPLIRGSLAGSNLRLQSAETGTDVTQLTARGSFNGSRLTLDTLAGRTAGNGTVSGSGVVSFAEMSANKGPGIDIKLGVRNAMLLARPDMALAATGPMRIVSDGDGGTIAGRLAIESARWRLGQSQAAAELPQIRTREINRGADVAPASVRRTPWHFLIDAAGPYRIRVQGLGIDSEWGADIRLRGTLDAPAIGGAAQLVSGTYEFAGKRFDITRGRLNFDGGSPPDPRLDIAATAAVNGLSATVTVAGTSLKPEISFSSIPAMPEEELLSRLLFGDSITQISAPEALQLGAALASLHGGGGLDPINKLRSAIGLDRLRIVNADPTLNRQTGVAAGKYIGRHFYAEIVTDGRGYSATNLEFRVTNWLSLLGTVSTVGRQSVNAKISKDY